MTINENLRHALRSLIVREVADIICETYDEDELIELVTHVETHMQERLALDGSPDGGDRD